MGSFRRLAPATNGTDRSRPMSPAPSKRPAEGSRTSDRALLETTLYRSADALRVIAALVDPVMPEAAERIRRMLGLPQEQWSDLKPNTLRAGTRLGAIEPLLPRIEKTVEE